MSTTAPAVNSADAGVSEGAALETEWASLPGPSLADAQPEETQGASTNGAETGAASGERTTAGGAADAGQAAATGAEKQGEEPKAAESKQADEWAIDQALFDKAAADPTHGAFVKSLHEKLTKALGWREHFANLDEAREFKALAPGGLEELKTKVQAGVDARTENAEFASGDPARQASVLQSIAADMPEAFAASAKPYLETLRTANPEAFQKIGLELAMEGLKADGLPEMLAPIFSAMAKGDAASDAEQEAAGKALGQLYQWAEKAGLREPGAKPTGKTAEAKLPPEVQKALDENRQYKENERKAVAEGFKTWKESLDTSFKTAINAETLKLIDGAVPKNLPKATREYMVADLTEKFFKAIEGKLNADTDLGEKAAAVISNGAWQKNGEQTRTQIQNLWFGRAKQLLPFVAKDILNPFAEATVAANNSRVEKENQNAGRTEVSGGAPANTGGKKLSPKDVKGLSDEQILEL